MSIELGGFSRAVLNLFSKNMSTAVENFQVNSDEFEIRCSYTQIIAASFSFLHATCFLFIFFGFLVVNSDLMLCFNVVGLGFTSLGATTSSWFSSK